MNIYIKNMVCQRCIMAVKNEVEKLGFQNSEIHLGHLELPDPAVNTILLNELKTALGNLGFEILDDKKSQLVEQIKNLVIDKIHYSDSEIRYNWSVVIAEKLQYEYNYISNMFSDSVGISIEQFIIRQKIEKIKELLLYGELSLAEISYRMGYSSVAYLSNQFKKVTGMPPGQFRKLPDNNRIAIDQL